MVEDGPCRHDPNIFAGMPVHVLRLATMCPSMVFACLTVIVTCWIVTELLSCILTYMFPQSLTSCRNLLINK